MPQENRIMHGLMRNALAGPIACYCKTSLIHEDTPKCKECSSEMTCILHIDLSQLNVFSSKGHLLVYQCEADPGMCDDWDPIAGGNKVIYVEKCNTKPTGDSYLSIDSRVLSSKDELIAFSESNSNCYGKIGEPPLWIQGDETPTCTCGKTMELVCEIDESANENFNFGGGGASYTFLCQACNVGAFLWQC